jgi:hypothetical protein
MMTLAALCISAVVASAPNTSTAYRCEPLGGPVAAVEAQPLPKAVAPAVAAPAPIATPAKAKPKALRMKHTCKAPKRAYFHRRHSRTWWTCS